MPRGVGREMLAEFLGTFVLIVFGVGVVAQTVLSKNAAGSALGINIAWGLAVTMGCYVAAGVTGGGRGRLAPAPRARGAVRSYGGRGTTGGRLRQGPRPREAEMPGSVTISHTDALVMLSHEDAQRMSAMLGEMARDRKSVV